MAEANPQRQAASGTGSMMIAATTIYHDLTLATHNTSDFERIKPLKVVDPLQA